MRSLLLLLLLLCLVTAKLVVTERQKIRDTDEAESAGSLEPLRIERDSGKVSPKKKAMDSSTKSIPSPGQSSQQQLMDKPAIRKDPIPSPPRQLPRAMEAVPIQTPGKSAADVVEPKRKVSAKKNAPSPLPPKAKTDLEMANNSPLNEKPINGVGLGPQGFDPAGTGPLAGSPNPGVIPMGPAFDPRAPGPHNGWGYYNEFNYPSRLARPRAFSYNDAQRVAIKASLPFMLASFILAAMYIL